MKALAMTEDGLVRINVQKKVGVDQRQKAILVNMTKQKMLSVIHKNKLN